ncbi:MAG: WYL domain-containing protein [Eubacteriales bacterium]|nr:WYL domain-containing protein [Eubacteriales bacterium]
MAYSELIKNFNRIRAYLRSFYVFGFRHREEFTQKSARSYDNERRRVESWLGDYMSFGQDEDGRRVFLSVDSRSIPENPLYRAFRTKSFTARDITLHFHLLDILRAAGGLSITEVMDELAYRFPESEEDDLPDESTVRKKLREYASLGLLRTEKRGRETIYLRNEDQTDPGSWDAAAAFFSEAAPLGVIGSYIQDRLPEKIPFFRFKHHYILNALDSEVLYAIFPAIGEKRLLTFTWGHRIMPRRKTSPEDAARAESRSVPPRRKTSPEDAPRAESPRVEMFSVLPLKLYIGTQSGRQYLLAWSPDTDRFSFYRVDLMDNVKAGALYEVPDGLDARLEDFCAHIWGVAGNSAAPPVHIEMTVCVGPEEGFIADRLEREKRCGSVEKLDDTHWRFSADVYDALEMLPWLRTFTGRVTDLKCTDRRVITRFWEDFDRLAEMYLAEKG